MASERTIYSVVRSGNGDGWIIEKEEAGPLEEHRTKLAAVSAARERARAQRPSGVRVHTPDGAMEFENTFG
jgi:hypothetical protein